jgi:hypothetical protein
VVTINRLLPLLLFVVIGLSLAPVVSTYANELTEAPEAVAFVESAVLPETDNLKVAWTTAPTSWSTASDKAFVSTTASFLFIGIDTSSAYYDLDGDDGNLTTEMSLTFDLTGTTDGNRTLLAPDALAATYGFTWVDLDDHGVYYDTTIGSLIDLIPMLYIVAIIATTALYIKFT